MWTEDIGLGISLVELLTRVAELLCSNSGPTKCFHCVLIPPFLLILKEHVYFKNLYILDMPKVDISILESSMTWKRAKLSELVKMYSKILDI